MTAVGLEETEGHEFQFLTSVTEKMGMPLVYLDFIRRIKTLLKKLQERGAVRVGRHAVEGEDGPRIRTSYTLTDKGLHEWRLSQPDES